MKVRVVDQPLVEPLTELKSILKFTEADLAANRQGYLTKRQKRRLFWRWLPGPFNPSKEPHQRIVLASVLIVGLMMPVIIAADKEDWFGILFFTVWSFIWVYFSRPFRKAWGDIRHDVRDGRVLMLEGEIRGKLMTYKRGWQEAAERWAIVIRGEVFHVPRKVASIFASAEPDDYRVYYTPSSRNVLAIQPAANPAKISLPGTQDSTVPPAMQNWFDEADLAANRAGEVSRRQRRLLWLRRIGQSTIRAWALSTIPWTIWWLALLLIGQAVFSGPNGRPGVVLGLLLMPIVYLLVMVGGRSLLLLPSVRADRRGPPGQTTGPIRLLVEYDDRRRPRYWLRVQRIELRIPGAWVDLLVEGQPYVVYFTPRTRLLLSLERVSEDYFVGEDEDEG